MNFDNITLGELKKLQNMLGSTAPEKKGLADDLIGSPVIVRSHNEGVNFGTLQAADETGCVISGVRRLHYHKPADKHDSWYEGVAIHGLHEDSRASCAVPVKVIVEDYSLTPVTDKAAASIAAFKSHEQS